VSIQEPILDVLLQVLATILQRIVHGIRPELVSVDLQRGWSGTADECGK
jgi:hypothetical protein